MFLNAFSYVDCVLCHVFYVFLELKLSILAVPWAMMMYSVSLESPEQGKIDFFKKKRVTALLRYFISIKNIPILCSTYFVGISKRKFMTRLYQCT